MKCLTLQGLSYYHSRMMTSLNQKFSECVTNDKITMNTNIEESGYVLDGRQANPNIENSLAYNIQKVSDDFIAYTDYISEIKETQTTYVESWFTSSACKIGSFIFVDLDVTFKIPSGVSTTSITLAKVPKILDPLKNVSMNTFSNNGQQLYVYIDSWKNDTPGNIGLRSINSKYLTNDGIRLCLFYLSKDIKSSS